MRKIVSLFAVMIMISGANGDIDTSSLSIKERMKLFGGKNSDNTQSSKISEKNNASSSEDVKSSETKEKTSVQSLKNFWEQKAVDAQKPMEKILPEVGNQLGGITKECEDSSRREAYKDINDRCETVRGSDNPDDFNDFYKDYQKAAPKLKDLRNLGEYSPEASEQKAITNVDDMRNDKFERYGTLDRNAPCKKFAEHMSVVHPANNKVFEKTMKCIADARSNSVVGEDEVQ